MHLNDQRGLRALQRFHEDLKQRQRSVTVDSCVLSAPWFNQSANMTNAKYFQELKSTDNLYI